MALPASPPIDLLAILAEFGAPAGTSLTAMVRGGAYVPNTPANAGIPTAAPIDVLDFLGASAVVVDLQDASQSAMNVGATATAELRFGATHVQGRSNGGSLGNKYQWLLAGSRASYDVRWTIVTGAPTTGPTGTWTNLASDVIWTLVRSVNGSVSCTGTIEIRPAGGGATIDSATFTLTATRNTA